MARQARQRSRWRYRLVSRGDAFPDDLDRVSATWPGSVLTHQTLSVLARLARLAAGLAVAGCGNSAGGLSVQPRIRTG